ncbi:hypothetical protein Thert_03089 [Thermoanaerobacterium thermosaccharolyticum]|jgi:hypothetical protein|uniref:Uncharacterized protein n=1 Tax=Thermoanaerobacterium thermosaccharolyticum TaxID=1517 RepID=A0A223I2A1_THETR|nr:hypothetical protein Thert_03089 [Thermoanaerobacterium thermosaccharolyticum]
MFKLLENWDVAIVYFNFLHLIIAKNNNISLSVVFNIAV